MLLNLKEVNVKDTGLQHLQSVSIVLIDEIIYT